MRAKVNTHFSCFPLAWPKLSRSLAEGPLSAGPHRQAARDCLAPNTANVERRILSAKRPLLLNAGCPTPILSPTYRRLSICSHVKPVSQPLGRAHPERRFFFSRRRFPWRSAERLARRRKERQEEKSINKWPKWKTMAIRRERKADQVEEKRRVWRT